MLAYVLTLFLLFIMILFFSCNDPLSNLIYQRTILIILFLDLNVVIFILILHRYNNSKLFDNDKLIELFMIFIKLADLIEI